VAEPWAFDINSSRHGEASQQIGSKDESSETSIGWQSTEVSVKVRTPQVQTKKHGDQVSNAAFMSGRLSMEPPRACHVQSSWMMFREKSFHACEGLASSPCVGLGKLGVGFPESGRPFVRDFRAGI